jgi:hypothetical protein
MNIHRTFIACLAVFVALSLAAAAQSTRYYHDNNPIENPDDIAPLLRDGDHVSIVEFAEYHPVLLKRAVDNYAACLRCGNNGVVESAIAQLARLRLDVPTLSAEKCLRELRRLAGEGATPVIRIKARFALLLCDEPALFDTAALQLQRDPEKLFADIATQLRAKLFGANGNE